MNKMHYIVGKVGGMMSERNDKILKDLNESLEEYGCENLVHKRRKDLVGNDGGRGRDGCCVICGVELKGDLDYIWQRRQVVKGKYTFVSYAAMKASVRANIESGTPLVTIKVVGSGEPLVKVNMRGYDSWKNRVEGLISEANGKIGKICEIGSDIIEKAILGEVDQEKLNEGLQAIASMK